MLHKQVSGKNASLAKRYSGVDVKSVLEKLPSRNRSETEVSIKVDAKLYLERKLNIVNHKGLWMRKITAASQLYNKHIKTSQKFFSS